MSIATLQAVNLDCPDSKVLAEFYAELTGWPLHDYGEGFYAVGEQNGLQLYFQQVEGYAAPTWPTQERGQQFHLDFAVENVDEAVRAATAAGATLAEFQPHESTKILLDPAGHPFCLFVPR